MNRRKRIAVAAAAVSLCAVAYAALASGESDMRMTALEKFFVNSPGHTGEVARQSQQLLDRVAVEDGWTYLDVGCGVGAAARKIAESRPLIVTAVDIDPEQIETARAAGPRENLQFHAMDATRLNFPDGNFNIVATSKVTHHIPDWEKAFSEMARVTSPGGYLIYTDFAPPEWLCRAARVMVPAAGCPSDQRLRALAAAHGLTEVYRSRRVALLDLIWRKQGT